jgi:hypothetical protein
MTAKRWMTVALLSTVMPLLGQDGRLLVMVADITGAVVEGAVVTVGERRGRTDASGVASFIALPMGRVEVVAVRPGFKTWRGTYNILSGQELRVDARLQVKHVKGNYGVIVMARGNGGAGQVRVLARDVTGAARIDAEVSISCAGRMPLKTRVDDLGIAVFPDLPPGECQISVTAPGFKIWRGTRLVKAGTDDRVEARLEVGVAGTKVEVRPKPAGRRFMDWLASCTRR